MRVLVHFALCPFSRKIRIQLVEKDLQFELFEENPYLKSEELTGSNPAGEVPVLVDGEAQIIDSRAIADYLDERYPETSCMPRLPDDRAECRRLVAWFDNKFYREVTEPLFREQIVKMVMRSGNPEGKYLRVAQENLRSHLAYHDQLVGHHNWLVGSNLSQADMAAAAQFSTLDYLGVVPWNEFPNAKEWYARIKSRPSFRPILQDFLRGRPPGPNYVNLDF